MANWRQSHLKPQESNAMLAVLGMCASTHWHSSRSVRLLIDHQHARTTRRNQCYDCLLRKHSALQPRATSDTGGGGLSHSTSPIIVYGGRHAGLPLPATLPLSLRKSTYTHLFNLTSTSILETSKVMHCAGCACRTACLALVRCCMHW